MQAGAAAKSDALLTEERKRRKHAEAKATSLWKRFKAAAAAPLALRAAAGDEDSAGPSKDG